LNTETYSTVSHSPLHLFDLTFMELDIKYIIDTIHDKPSYQHSTILTSLKHVIKDSVYTILLISRDFLLKDTSSSYIMSLVII